MRRGRQSVAGDESRELLEQLMRQIDGIADEHPWVDDLVIQLGKMMAARCIEICQDVAEVAPNKDAANGALVCAETIKHMLLQADAAVAQAEAKFAAARHRT